MKPHKHAELIKAWADGAEIEVLCGKDYWEVRQHPNWHPDDEFRIKPEPKPDVVVETWIQQGHGKEIAIFYNSTPKNIRFTFNYYTGELKSAEVLK